MKKIAIILLAVCFGLALFANGQKEAGSNSGSGNSGFVQKKDGSGEGEGGSQMQGKGKKIKRILNNGDKISISGTLKPFDEDCTFTADDGTEYYLYMAPAFYLDEIKLVITEGMKVKIDGFVYLKEIVPNVFTVNGKAYKFWDEFGVPPWAGSMKNKNQGEGKGGDGGGN